MERVMRERFIGEPIKPLTDTADTARMASGEPGLPSRFTWRGRDYEVVTVIRSWRETGRCHHGSPELYVRKHWYEVVTDSGETMKLYFDRQPKKGSHGLRWWLFTLSASDLPTP
jgi:Domain of unknown function (DUF6504)